MLYLLQVIYKWLSVLCVSILSLFGIGNYNETEIFIDNFNHKKDVSVVSTVTAYGTDYIYNSKLPSNVSNVLKEGILGISYEDETGDHIIQEMENEIVEKGIGAYGLFKGTLTGYGPDCVGCSKLGNVACLTETKQKHSLITNGIYYTDDEYGKVRIVAAATAFPCGTIIQISKEAQTPFYAVVLDRGGSMNYAWSEGRVWIDLAYEADAMAGSDNLTGRNNINFSVQRWGW